MKVSTKSWHYKLLKFMYGLNNFGGKDVEFYFEYELRKMTECDYILRVAKNVFWAVYGPSVVLALVGMLISVGLMLPLLAIAFIIGVCFAISATYEKYNAKCAKIEMTDEGTQ
jgi:hypothetical protein